MSRRNRYSNLSPDGRELRERLDREMKLSLGGAGSISGNAGYGGAYGGPGAYPDSTGFSGQVPPMEQMRDGQGDFTEYGAPGTAIFNGIIYGEEYNPDFEWRNGVRIYDQMRKNDYQIFASLLMTELPVQSASWKITPANDSPEATDHASFIETALFHEMDGTWNDALRHAQLSRAYGFFVAEKVFKKGKDGMVYWQKFAPRMPKTIWRWWIDENNELVGVQQWTFKEYTYHYINIPSSKLLVFTHRQEGNNFEGVSVLRTAYKPWFYKEVLMRIMGIGFEREHVGIPVFKLPKGHTAQDIKRAQNIGRNMRANEQAYITIPDTWVVEWLKGNSGRSSSHTPILDAIGLMDNAISRNVLSQSMNLGSTETGAYNVAEEQNEILMQSLQADASQIAQVFNDKRVGAIPQLIKMNFPDPEMYPMLEVNRLASPNIESMGTTLANMARFGLLTATPDVEDYVREMMGIPSAPLSVIESTKLGAQQSQMGIDPRTQQPLDPQAAAMQKAQLESQQISNVGAKQSQQQEQEAHAQAMKAGAADPRGSGDRRSKGPGQDQTISASDVVPPEYRTSRYLGESRYPMSPRQRHVYTRMVHEHVAKREPYRLLSTSDWRAAELANRMTPAHPNFERRRDVVARRLKKTYADLENSLTGDAEQDEEVEQVREQVRASERRPVIDPNIKALSEQVAALTKVVGTLAHAQERRLSEPPPQPASVVVHPAQVNFADGAFRHETHDHHVEGEVSVTHHMDDGAIQVTTPDVKVEHSVDARTTIQKGAVEAHHHMDPGAVRVDASHTIEKGAVQHRSEHHHEHHVDASTVMEKGAIQNNVEQPNPGDLDVKWGADGSMKVTRKRKGE